MNYNDGQIPSFEKHPGTEAEQERSIPPSEDFEKSFASGVPEFAGSKSPEIPADKYGIAKPENNYYGETVKNDAAKDESATSEPSEEYDPNISDAAALINYGIGAASESAGGMEVLFQKVKAFDASGREDPIGDFFQYLGVDSPIENRIVQDQNAAASAEEAAFRSGANAPSQRKSVEGARAAFRALQDLIRRTENGVDPRFNQLNAEAATAGMPRFDYIARVVLGGEKNLMGVLNYLAQQREQAEFVEASLTDESDNSEQNSPEQGGPESGTPESGASTPPDRGQPAEGHERLNPEILRKAA